MMGMDYQVIFFFSVTLLLQLQSPSGLFLCISTEAFGASDTKAHTRAKPFSVFKGLIVTLHYDYLK